MRVLGIETSCDETAAAVVDENGMRSNAVFDQIDLHALYGGVVPELASRAHIQSISPVIRAALRDAETTADQLDAIAVTTGPGLVGALLVGVSAAKGMALSLGIPLLPIHHMEGHLVSPLLTPGSQITFPFVALLVSGGHTLLVHARAFGDYVILGQTRDDAVGEAFDKGARLLGLGYPGGPAISKLALGGNRAAIPFPRVLLDRTRFDFSFSGLKTSLRTYCHRNQEAMQCTHHRRDVAASYQEALVETLAIKAMAACQKVGADTLVVAGGVGANRRLREILEERGAKLGIFPYFPPLSLCTDNGAMIALAGRMHLERGATGDLSVNATPRWPLVPIET
ncbi:MAG: tRNA (adenosine(37)-N6)-threonylcarbamoyltransferase complex transferase subunit TsaD [Magnetococcales bacterium]|nr:tRNA (adenosine(37)-N6)-threonylcarbamoyltransferase complex transferase subunit TsaD [Magnetococcales bacterium]